MLLISHSSMYTYTYTYITSPLDNHTLPMFDCAPIELGTSREYEPQQVDWEVDHIHNHTHTHTLYICKLHITHAQTALFQGINLH